MRIDLNADLGEGLGPWRLGDDEALLDVVTSANVACGFHAGDPLIARRTVEAAAVRGVAVGAHPSYRDLAGFGRRALDVPPVELAADVVYQLGALQGVAAAAGVALSHVKPHGALYNRIATDETQARAVVDAIASVAPDIAVLGLPGSVFLRLAAEAGLRPVAEAFADRSYAPDGTLVARREEGSVLTDPEAVAARAVRIVTEGRVEAVDGTDVAVRADSLCVHGDSPGAVALAVAVRRALEDADVTVAAPA